MNEQADRASPGAASSAPTLAVAGLMLAMASIQLGASLAKGLFPLAGSSGVAALRILLAALILAPILKPWRVRVPADVRGPLLLYGVALGAMNVSFYKALDSIPLGIAVAVEFVGPLGVALLASRRAADLLWAGLAVAGLALLAPWGDDARRIDPVGIGYALGAGVAWAVYIVAGQRASHALGPRATGLGMIVAAAVALPLGIAQSGRAMLDPALLPMAAAVALLSSALPYTLEMAALRRLPAATFGILMSLEPAFGALAGYWWLGEKMTPTHMAAMGAIMLASAGTTLNAARTRKTRAMQDSSSRR